MKTMILNKFAIMCVCILTSSQAFASDTASISSRIIGGVESDNAQQYPWIVSLKYKGTDQHFCGASLINEQWILTAAHCVHELTKNDLIATVAEYDLSSSPKTPSSAIEQIIVHPFYEQESQDNDIALLKLSSPVNNTTITILPSAELEQLISSSTNNVTAIGWGSTIGYSGFEENIRTSFPDILNTVTLPLLSQTICNQFSSAVTDNMICAGDYDNGGKDSCQGDSGGPLLFDQTGNEDWQQVGIVSFGFGCAEAKSPGVYTKVANYQDWITQNIHGVSSTSNNDYFITNVNLPRAFPITLKNYSEQSVSPTFTLSDEQQFTLDDSQCNSLTPLQECQLNLTYAPSNDGTDVLNITVNTEQELGFNSTISLSAKAMQATDDNTLPFDDNDDISWYQSATSPWIQSADGSYLQSPSIDDSSSTEFTAVISGDGTVNYSWAVSSEENYDFLTVFINGVKIDDISGSQKFITNSHAISGENTVITWQYAKDSTQKSGADSAFLYNILLTVPGSDNTTTEPDSDNITDDPTMPELNFPENDSGGSLHWLNLLFLLSIALCKPLLKKG